jgi:formylglycine-generating enzyme
VYVNWAANGYRLPTQVEWEKAARGGAPGHRFPWSDTDTINWSRANYSAAPGSYSYDVNSTSGCNPAWTSGGAPYTAPVGSFAANGYGLYDMAGNVDERCWDLVGFYPNPGLWGRARRGGSWAKSAYFCRPPFWNLNWAYPPAFSSYDLGFRCALSPGQ